MKEELGTNTHVHIYSAWCILKVLEQKSRCRYPFVLDASRHLIFCTQTNAEVYTPVHAHTVEPLYNGHFGTSHFWAIFAVI